jgi:predicted metal-dependent phosphoesterase TrpH
MIRNFLYKDTMNVDLHSHTTASDGVLKPQELVDLASERGIDLLAITDHDTMDAFDTELVYPSNLQLIQGIELSCKWGGNTVHILGLNVDRSHNSLKEGIRSQKQIRRERAHKIADKLKILGFTNTLQAALDLSDGGQIGRPHFAKHLVNIGAARSEQQAFKKILGEGKSGYVRADWAELGVAIDWIEHSGGTSVLAHPTRYGLSKTKLLSLFRDFKNLGGKAIEVISGHQLPDKTLGLATLCDQFGFLSSCGSDFHRPDESWAALGHVPKLPERCRPVWTDWV